MPDANQSFLKRRWKLLLNITTLAALGLLVFLIREDLADTILNLGKVQTWALLLLIPIQIINYDAQARLYKSLFGLVGSTFKYKEMFKIALELNFVNHVFPSGGVSGISYFGVRLRSMSDDMTGSKATLVQFVKLGLVFLSFEVLLLFGMLFLTAAGKVNNFTLLIGGSLTTLLFLGTLAFAYIIGSKHRINVTFTALTKGLNRLIYIVRPKHPETINISEARESFTEIHDNYRKIADRLPQLKKPFFYAFMVNATEVLSVYVVYIAFSEWVNLGAVILAYAVANFAGLVSVLPGGVGIYEALMTAVLAATGVPAAVSLPVTVMYRVLNTLIQVPPGYYLYHRALSGKAKGT